MLSAIISTSVAPRVGAWIETQGVATLAASMMSHPVWVRGLKLEKSENEARGSKSHPVWVRGLKQALRFDAVYF